MIESFTIDDPILNPLNECIEVTVKIEGRRKRWCFFVTTEWLSDYFSGRQTYKPVDIDGFKIKQYTVLGESIGENTLESFEFIAVPHMIVVKEINKEIIHKTLHYLDENDALIKSTIKL